MPELISQTEFRKDAAAAVDSLYNFNDAAAEKIMEDWNKDYPNHPIWSLFDAMTEWWIVLSDLENHSHDDKLLKLMKKADYKASKLLHKQPNHVDGLIIKAIANGYIARHYANRSEWLTSLKYGRTALKAYKYLQKAMPDLPDLKLAKGIKLYYTAYLPEAYPVVKAVSWILPKGDRQEGLQLLKQASQQAIFARAEATYFLGNIYFNYEHKPEKAIGYFQQLHEKYPNNNYYVRLLVHNYYKIGWHDKALQLISHILQQSKQHKLPFDKVLKQELFYWKGRILKSRGDMKQAADLMIDSFNMAEQLPRTKYRKYYTAAGFYAGKVLLTLNKKEEAVDYLKAAAKSKAGEGYKEQAEKLLERIR
ncbi:MAG TPA: hypothetical protein VK106_00590 [Balneolaceae bacterium]|nr:hypothetical protein [Balneolaceae bacterium]